MKVELSKEAEAQVDQIDLWWRANRPAAASLFTNELDQALLDLAAMPSLGTVYEQGPKPVRRILLRRTHCHLYFIEEHDRICVVAVWSVFRGTGPPL